MSGTGRRGRLVAATVAVVGLVALAACATEDTATGEARTAYALLTEEPLWDAHPPGYHLDYEDSLGCRLKPHSDKFRDVSSPGRMYTAQGSAWALPIAWYATEARHQGWTVGKPQRVNGISGEPTDHIDLDVRKEVDGHRFVLHIGVTESGPESLLSIDAEVEDVDICPPGTPT